ncbi:MAG: hypothetical protein ACRCZ9_12290 [Fusobacteriaceae bacterium]
MKKETILSLISNNPSLLLKSDFINSVNKYLSVEDHKWLFRHVSAYAISMVELDNERLNLVLHYDNFGLMLTSIAPYRSFKETNVKFVYAAHMGDLLTMYSHDEVVDSCLCGVELSFEELNEVIVFLKRMILDIVDNTEDVLSMIQHKCLNVIWGGRFKNLQSITNLTSQTQIDYINDEFDSINRTIETLLPKMNNSSDGKKMRLSTCDNHITRSDTFDMMYSVINMVNSNNVLNWSPEEYIYGTSTLWPPINLIQNASSCHDEYIPVMDSILVHKDSAIPLTSIYNASDIPQLEKLYAIIFYCRSITSECDADIFIDNDESDIDILKRMLSDLYTDLRVNYTESIINKKCWRQNYGRY